MSSRTAEKFVLRLRDGMRDRIAELAKENHRSMNSEILERLEQSFEFPPMFTASVESTSSWVPREDMAVSSPGAAIGILRKLFLRDGQLFAKVEEGWGHISDYPVASLAPLRCRPRVTLESVVD